MANNLIKNKFENKFRQTEEIYKVIINDFKKIERIINIILSKIKLKKKIFICGNGGSASDAQHIATELVVRFDKKYKRKGIPAICLNTDSTLITACANDFDFGEIFKRQLEALANNGDLLICLSTSGNSKNILEVLKFAKKKKINSISLLGNCGGKAKDLTDNSLIIESKNTALIQEAHIFIAHFIIEQIEIIIKKKK